MQQRLLTYLMALTTLGACCALYHATFVAWVEPPAPLPVAMTNSPAVRRGDDIDRLFPPGSWQTGNCKRLQTRDGVLLFENWQQMSDDQWKLWPIAVIVGQNSQSPLIMEAMEGAEIKFTESLDVMSGGAPPIERGRMVGKVRIQNLVSPAAPTNSLQHDDRIEIEAAEVGIDHRKVWTTEPFRLRLGAVELTGRDLTLHLASVGGLANAGENALSVLDRLELIYLDQLTVPLKTGGLWSTSTKAAQLRSGGLPGTAVPSDHPVGNQASKPGLATVRCGGRVVYQFASNELSLQDRVEFRHQASLDSPHIDTFLCDQMKLRFTNLLSERERSDAIEDYLVSMLVVGRPAQISLPDFDAHLAAGQIEFDTRSKVLRMGGPAGVLVAYAGNRWQFGQINYTFHPTDPKQLGTFDAIGPGGMDVSAQFNVPVKRLQWTEGVRFERLPEQGLFSLIVNGSVVASTTDGGVFRCDAAQATLQDVSGPQASSTPQLLPKQFQATGQVAIETPEITVATKLLQLYFEHQSTPLVQNTAQSGSLADNSLRRWVRQPGESTPQTSFAANSTPIPQARPSIHGDTIRAKLLLSPGELTARDLTVVGDVSLRHVIQTPTGNLEALLTGDRLVLSDGGNHDVLQIGSGIDRPAKLELGDGYFIGPMIQVRTSDNVVWIKDAGEFQLPTQVLPRLGAVMARGGMSPLRPTQIAVASAGASSSESDRSDVEWISAPRCRWKGQMIFDGRTAMLTDGVDLHATIASGRQRDVWDLQLTGDQLQLVLDQDVRVRDVASMKSATVQQVTISGSSINPLLVTVNQVNSLGLRKARHVLATPQLIMTPGAGSVTSPGPGWYRAWLASNPAAGFTGLSSDKPQMFGVHLVYQQALQADLNHRRLDFVQGVRIAGRAVTDWDDLIEVTQIQGLRQGESTLDCDRLRLGMDASIDHLPVTAAWEMESIGNVAFQTRNEKGLFNGTAERASYTASKDIFLIEGLPGRSATMNQTLPTGQPGMSLRVKRMTVNPKSMEIQNSEFDGFQLGTLPASVAR